VADQGYLLLAVPASVALAGIAALMVWIRRRNRKQP
jgi:hypothetical protein